MKSVLREKKYANKKIITIIDDLDRLDSSKIVEALDALKVFMDLDKCIFIVPFDDAILKKALEEKRVSNLTSTESEIDSDLILDKLFQYKVYIPELVKINIKKYAVELFQENCQDFIMEYMNGNMEEACRIVQNIVIHKHVSTPRQVKKLINNFINNMIIACKREKKQTVQKGFATELDSIRMIAKISVLQADFNEFYDTLFLNMNAMEEIVEVYRGENDSPSEEVGRFFENIDERYELKPKYQSLINYLIHTEKYNKVPSLASYIYMAQDKISALTGDKKQQEFMETMLSKDHLPELWRRRAEHYYSEFARAEKGAELWREGDLEGYGQLVFESGKSSIYSYECGCDELKKLYEIMWNTDGIYGGRFSGAGFKGCCMALVDPEKVEDIKVKVAEEYLKAFPELEGKYSAYVCESADGVRL